MIGRDREDCQIFKNFFQFLKGYLPVERITYETVNKTKFGGGDMKRRLAKIIATMAIAGVVLVNTDVVAEAHHSGFSNAQGQIGYCYQDGSCDVNGVCQNGTSCDGSVHHAQTYNRGGSGHHRSGHHH